MSGLDRFELPTFWFVVGRREILTPCRCRTCRPHPIQKSCLSRSTKFIFNLRGDDGAATGGLAVDSNLGWKGPDKYVATVPQVFDLWADPQERYDIFMNNFTERTWMGVVMEQELQRIMATYIKYPPRKVQSYGNTGPITLSGYGSNGSASSLRRKESISPCPPGTSTGSPVNSDSSTDAQLEYHGH